MTRIGILNAAGDIRLVTTDTTGEDISHGTVADVPDRFPDSMDYLDGVFVDALPRIYARLAARIDAAAEAIIISFVTPGAGIQEARSEKRREVERIVTESDPDPADYPFLAAEATARGVALSVIVSEVQAAVALWLGAGAQVEAVRVAGKAAIREAATRADRETIAEATLAQLQTIAAAAAATGGGGE